MTWDDVIVLLANPLIVSVAASLVVSLVVLGLDKLVLTPRARKRNYQLRDLERRLDAHAELVALLKAARKKQEAWGRIAKSRKDLIHHIEKHDIKALDQLFSGEKASSRITSSSPDR